jgi:hypothetical protein
MVELACGTAFALSRNKMARSSSRTDVRWTKDTFLLRASETPIRNVGLRLGVDPPCPAMATAQLPGARGGGGAHGGGGHGGAPESGCLISCAIEADTISHVIRREQQDGSEQIGSSRWIAEHEAHFGEDPSATLHAPRVNNRSKPG